MQLKVLSLLACVAVVSAGPVPETTRDTNNDNPIYHFQYNVNDSITGDVKNQIETRVGDSLYGLYSLNDADGYKRTVHYCSDDVSGLKVFVRRERLPNVQANAVGTQKITSESTAAITRTPKLVIPKSSTTTVVNHHQPTVYHHALQTVHFLNTSPSAAIVKSAPTLIATTHHHLPAIVQHTPTVVHPAPTAVVHHTPALFKTAISAPHHVSYVHYH